jgi:hypothetical protein
VAKKPYLLIENIKRNLILVAKRAKPRKHTREEVSGKEAVGFRRIVAIVLVRYQNEHDLVTFQKGFLKSDDGMCGDCTRVVKNRKQLCLYSTACSSRIHGC